MRSQTHAQWPRPMAGLRGIVSSDLPGGVIAGITFANLIVPLNIGNARAAELPSVTGLYAAIVSPVLCALLATSHHLVVSPDASITAFGLRGRTRGAG